MHLELEIYLNGEQFMYDHPQYDERIDDLLGCRESFHGFIGDSGYVDFPNVYDFNYLLDYQESINKLDGFSTQIFMWYDGDATPKRYMLNQQY